MDYKEKVIALLKGKELSKDQKEKLENIFPELKESEDEKMKKEIVRFIQMEVEDEIVGNKWISWLEKQNSNVDNANKEYWRGYREGKQEILDKYAELEKQGEQKCIPKYKIGDYVKNTNYKGEPIYEIVYMDKECYICEYRGKERMGDKAVMHFSFDNPYLRLVQKPTDKVEPKFKVGDWVVDNKNGIVKQILSYKHGVYKHTYGYSGKIFENEWRMWTINDAKDGDVLTFKNDICGIIICKSPTDYDTGSYCRLVNDNFINKEESGWDSTLLVPTTKEQRDLLFQKMKEADYKWDTEKKELKKIEQKSQRMISAEAKEAMYDKPALREDEVKINRIVACLENLNVADNDILLKDIDWLKSLKERIE